jgi:hypothetical protein
MLDQKPHWKGDRTYASQTNIRRAFWDQHPGYLHERKQYKPGREPKLHNDYSEECRMVFHQWKDSLHRQGLMTDKLCQSVTLGW